MAWSYRKAHSFRLALGSFVEDYANQVDLVELVHDDATDDWKFERVGGFDHPYPTTKIMWRPDEQGADRDQLATTGDYLRLWDVGEKKTASSSATTAISTCSSTIWRQASACATVSPTAPTVRALLPTDGVPDAVFA